jgi:hypothetical protein
MADTKISALPASTTPLAGTEVLPIVQSSTTRQVSVANLTAGRAISATSVTASTGNFVVGTSGQGIDFSATPGTGTSELLADYEEGTWTPGITFGGAAVGVTYGTRVGLYTKIGNVVSFVFNLGLTSKGSSAGAAVITGLPFTSSASGQSAVSVGYFADFLALTGAPCGRIGSSSTSIVISQTSATTAGDLFDTQYTNTTFLIVSGQYTV